MVLFKDRNLIFSGSHDSFRCNQRFFKRILRRPEGCEFTDDRNVDFDDVPIVSCLDIPHCSDRDAELFCCCSRVRSPVTTFLDLPVEGQGSPFRPVIASSPSGNHQPLTFRGPSSLTLTHTYSRPRTMSLTASWHQTVPTVPRGTRFSNGVW